MRPRYFVLAVALLCLLVLPGTALAKAKSDDDKIDQSVTTVLKATGGDDAVPVVVYTEPDEATVVAAAVPDVVETTEIPAFDAVAAYLLPDEIDALSLDDSVLMIVADNPVFGFDYASSLDITNLAIGLDAVASPAEGGPDGSGVGVAVIDSGITTTSDLGDSRIVGWKDFVDKRRRPYDDAGHGTFVAGLIAGDGTASLPLDQGGYATMQFRGVAPAANIIGVKVLDSNGSGSRIRGHVGHRLDGRPQERLQHPRDEPVARGQPGRPRGVRPHRAGRGVRLEARRDGRLRRRQRGRVRPRRDPVSGQQPLRPDGRRQRYPPDGNARRRRRHLLQLGRADALRRVRQARRRGAG